MHQRARAFRRAAEERYDLSIDVHEFPDGTKTAADAAEAIGCDVAQIASSIAMDADGRLVVVVTSGANRVSETRVAELEGVAERTVGMADAEQVKSTLGWAIGGVPPFCHDTAVPVYLDATLTDFDEVWAAAGTPTTVFPTTADSIVVHADATVADVAQ